MDNKNRFNVEEHTTLDNKIIDVFPNSHRYIHELEEKNKELKEKLDKYENPKDMTLFAMWCTEKVKEENKALLTLINWAVECDFGFDNFANDEYVNWEEFEKESNDMNYIESMIYYAEKYNKMHELEQGSDSDE